MAIGVSSFVDNVSQGNAGVPGGAGAGIKAYRAEKAATQTSAKVASNGMKNADAN